jgi:tRNA1Val (adenine37-N6)-methyltransferase
MGLFRFKHFSLDDSRCAMKIGTDSVLLGAWSSLPVKGTVLDAGCGCGIIAMMVAQRNPELKITGVEIDEDAASQALDNVLQSPFSERISILHADARQLNPGVIGYFNLIITNPPYFQQSLKSRNAKLKMARHDSSLSFEELIDLAATLLTPDGKLYLILPSDHFRTFDSKATRKGLNPDQILYVHHFADSPAVRVICSYSRNSCRKPSEEVLHLRNHDGQWSDDYLQCARDFLLFA